MANRTHQIVINIEEDFYDVFMRNTQKEKVSASALGRKLILRYLMETGQLPKDYVVNAIL